MPSDRVLHACVDRFCCGGTLYGAPSDQGLAGLGSASIMPVQCQIVISGIVRPEGGCQLVSENVALIVKEFLHCFASRAHTRFFTKLFGGVLLSCPGMSWLPSSSVDPIEDDMCQGMSVHAGFRQPRMPSRANFSAIHNCK